MPLNANKNLEVLSRALINPAMTVGQYHLDTKQITQFDCKSFDDMVDYWKFLLVEKYQACPGKTVMIEFNLTNIYYFTAVFAAWELGLTLIVDWLHAHSESQARSKYFQIHGQIDYAIVYSEQLIPGSNFYNKWDCLRTSLNCKEIITEKDFDDYHIKDHSKFREIADTLYATPDTQAIWTATSGSTGDARQQRVDHRAVYLQAKRLCQHLGYQPGDVSLHTNNLHHGASAVYHFLPSFMQAKSHYILNYSDILTDKHQEAMNELIVDHGINKLFLYTPDKMLSFLNSCPVMPHRVEITTLYYCTKEIVALAKEKNINVIKSVFGDTTIGYGFLVKTVCPKTQDIETYQPTLISARLDDFFDFDIRQGDLYVKLSGLGQTEWKTSHDNFELKDGNYYFLGRGTNYRINDEWINHHEIENKVGELFNKNQTEGATIVVDNEEQQVYLAIWTENPMAEKQLNKWLSERYKRVRITKTVRGLDKKDFMGARKISRQKLKEYFRIHVAKDNMISMPDVPWTLS